MAEVDEKQQLEASALHKIPSDNSESLDPNIRSIEKKLIRKVDFHLVPILFLLFLLAFVDR